MKKNSFVEGSFIATASIVFTKILGMLYVIPFYSTVGEQGAALYAYAYTIYNIFLDISTAGIPTAISKLVSEYDTLGMKDAKKRTLKIGKQIVGILSIVIFAVLMIFAEKIGMLILGDIKGGNTPSDVAFVIRSISFAILVIPYLSVSKGYLQGHKYIAPTSISQVIEQIIRIAFILIGSSLCLKLFNLSLTSAVGIAVFGAAIGGFSALLFLLKKIRDNKEKLDLVEDIPKDDISNKEIAKKIISYAIPFIIIDTTVSIYNFVNMVLISRTLGNLNYGAANTEFITTAVTTWSPKINIIVGAFAQGMVVSLIPTIVSSYARKDFKDVENKFNKALQMIIVICLPMVVGISLLASQIWSVFYGHNNLGATILMVNIFTALFSNLYMIVVSALQGLNKFKAVYKVCITGFVLNAILDVPLMLFFNLFKVAYMGAIFASIIGYGISIFIALKTLNKEDKLRFTSTFRTLYKTLVPVAAMCIVVLILKAIIPYNELSKVSCIMIIAVTTLFGAVAYLFLAYKFGIINKVFGRDYVRKIIQKLTFGKISS